MSDLVLTVEQAADVLECSTDLVRDLIHASRIPHVKLGPKKTVIPVRALADWLDGQAKDSITPLWLHIPQGEKPEVLT